MPNYFFRSITISKVTLNSPEESKKQESDAASTTAQPNEELEKFNKQIAELTEKNSDLLVWFKQIN